MQLHELKSPKGSRKRKKLVGRGQGSGHGKTSCRGENGQGSRVGRSTTRSFEGGQIPLMRRLPKVGFRSQNPTVYELINVEDLEKYRKGSVVNAEFLKKEGIIKSIFKPFKILGNGKLTKSFTVEAYKFSKSAEVKIKEAGGTIKIITKQDLLENSENKDS